jgi:DNA-binding MarR family transcriptional regulator
MPDVTRLLDRMEACGLVTRTRDSADRRLVTTRITDKSQQLLTELETKVAEEHCRRLGHLERKELKTLIQLLSQLRSGD